MSTDFKKDAKDGDNDGIVQDGTEFERPVSVKNDTEKVAIHAHHGVYWPGVGRIIRGYNIIPSAKAELWLSREGIRIATPEEVAREYGV